MLPKLGSTFWWWLSLIIQFGHDELLISPKVYQIEEFIHYGWPIRGRPIRDHDSM